MNSKQNRLLGLSWLVLAGMVTVGIGFGFMAVQQNYRQNANDPQIAFAKDVVLAIEQGAPLDQILASASVINVEENMSPFAMIFDKDGKIVGASAKLGDKDLSLPAGSIEFAKAQGKNYFTWQPKEGVRIATILLPAKDSFVLVGRNIQEVEARIKGLMYMAGGAWLALLGLSAIFVLLLRLALNEPVKAEVTEVVVVEEGSVSEDSAS